MCPSLPLPESIRYIPVPRDVIVHSDPRVLAAYLYLCIRRGMDGQADIRIDSLSRWYGLLDNKSGGKSNSHFISAIKSLVDLGYVELLDSDIVRGNIVEYFLLVKPFVVNGNKTEQRFAYIYLNEISDILNCFRNNSIDVHVFTVLKVFAYLRMQLGAERDLETNSYSESYASIGKTIGISKNSVARAIQILGCNGRYGSDICFENSLIPIFYIEQSAQKDRDSSIKKNPSRFRPCYRIKVENGEVIKTGLSPPKSL